MHNTEAKTHKSIMFTIIFPLHFFEVTRANHRHFTKATKGTNKYYIQEFNKTKTNSLVEGKAADNIVF